MLKVEHDVWNQTIQDLHRLATDSPHPRTRERFIALHAIASGHSNASRWAAQTGRENETVMRWVHDYNAHGPQAMTYRRTGGASPLLRKIRPRSSSRSLSTTSLRITA